VMVVVVVSPAPATADADTDTPTATSVAAAAATVAGGGGGGGAGDDGFPRRGLKVGVHASPLRTPAPDPIAAAVMVRLYECVVQVRESS
jgi:hypothetical protein